MQRTLALFAALALMGCDDVITTHFTDLEEAKSRRAFDRGWLPPMLPASARAIEERNDLDANTGTGSFAYDPAERAAYITKLLHAGAPLQAEQDLEILTVKTNGSCWEIRLPRGSGSARWRMHRL